MADNSSAPTMCRHPLLSLVTNTSSSMNKRSSLPLLARFPTLCWQSTVWDHFHYDWCQVTVSPQFPRILYCNTSYSSLLICFSHTLADTQVKPCWTLPILQDGYRKQFVKLTRTYCSLSCVIRSLLREEKRKEDGTHFSHTNSNIYYNNMSREKERKVHKVLWKSSIITRGWSN